MAFNTWKALVFPQELVSKKEEKTLEISTLMFENCLSPKMYLAKFSEIVHSRKYLLAKLLKFLICEDQFTNSLKIS